MISNILCFSLHPTCTFGPCPDITGDSISSCIDSATITLNHVLHVQRQTRFKHLHSRIPKWWLSILCNPLQHTRAIANIVLNCKPDDVRKCYWCLVTQSDNLAQGVLRWQEVLGMCREIGSHFHLSGIEWPLLKPKTWNLKLGIYKEIAYFRKKSPKYLQNNINFTKIKSGQICDRR